MSASNATPSTSKPRRSPRRFLAKELARAKQKTDPMLHRRRKTVRSTLETRATVPVGDLVARLQTDLRTERKEILEPLLHRLQALGRNFTQGREIPLSDVEDGLNLWETYLERLHDLHINQIRLAGPGEDHSDRCALPLIEIEGDPDRGRYRLKVIRSVWDEHNYHVSQYRGLLGLVLIGEAQAELAWEGFEEDYARTCLPTHFTPEAAQEWDLTLDRSHQDALTLREKVQAYLGRTDAFAGPPPTA
ncbi:MAG: hypothetical protein WAN74_07630 [Thermoplasmata archaeon]